MLYLSYNTYQKTNTVGGKIMQSKNYVTIASVSPKETSKVRGNFFPKLLLITHEVQSLMKTPPHLGLIRRHSAWN
jgi:hypothetical protein